MYNKKKAILISLFQNAISSVPYLPFQTTRPVMLHVVPVLDACDGFGDRLSHSGPQRLWGRADASADLLGACMKPKLHMLHAGKILCNDLKRLNG